MCNYTVWRVYEVIKEIFKANNTADECDELRYIFVKYVHSPDNEERLWELTDDSDWRRFKFVIAAK